eukprot:6830978-Prymnesium_polylepis.2
MVGPTHCRAWQAMVPPTTGMLLAGGSIMIWTAMAMEQLHAGSWASQLLMAAGPATWAMIASVLMVMLLTLSPLGPPLGTQAWDLYCDGDWTSTDLTLATISPQPTPGSTSATNATSSPPTMGAPGSCVE